MPVTPTLRSLAIMIRRGILKGISSIEELLDDTKTMVLEIKPEFSDQPVLLASVPGGRELIEGKALSTNGLGDFSKRRAIAAGYAENVSFYAWRRGMGTNTYRVTNIAMAKKLLAHDPQGHTFEVSYDNRTVDINVTAIAHGEQQHSTQMMTNAMAILHRTDYNISDQTKEEFLQTVINSDVDCQAASTPEALKKATRSPRYRGMIALREKLRAERRVTEILDDFQERMSELVVSSAWMNAVREKADAYRSKGAVEDKEFEDEEDVPRDLEEMCDLSFGDETTDTTTNMTAKHVHTLNTDITEGEGDEAHSYSVIIECFLHTLLDTPDPDPRSKRTGC